MVYIFDEVLFNIFNINGNFIIPRSDLKVQSDKLKKHSLKILFVAIVFIKQLKLKLCKLESLI